MHTQYKEIFKLLLIVVLLKTSVEARKFSPPAHGASKNITNKHGANRTDPLASG